MRARAGERGRREQHVAEFPTTVRGLLALRDWLAGHGVTQVVMEATGVYWKAPWAILEDEFELHAGQRAPRQAGGVGLALRLLSDVVLEQSSLVAFDLDS